MANMSYCRYENTYSDMDECLYYMTWDGIPESESEAKYAKRLYQLCKDYIDAYEEAEENQD